MRTAAVEIVNEPLIQRLRVTVRGAVQGVGFRPFIYRLARELGLTGWVSNSPQGVFIEVEGDKKLLRSFLLRIAHEKPPRSFIQSLESSYLDAVGFLNFEIRPSDESGVKTALVLPEIAVCSDCLSDITDPENRRFQYPFTNCTNCGPRFSIIEALPYDRPNTTMKAFKMCDECRSEYEDPADRRFHAQPNCCPSCGPHLEFWDADGVTTSSANQALLAAVEAIRGGKIVAVKGLGGFHLLVDARATDAVDELRHRKHRLEKPLALMFPSLAEIREICETSDLEKRLLVSPESPIVLLKKRTIAEEQGKVSPSVAPGNPYLGAMLPYTPLHYLLMKELGFPVVATSGNLSDEPICIDEYEAVERLGGIADHFLVHNRPIARHIDDSIVRVMMGREMVIRRARGYAPLPIALPNEMPPTVAVGAHLKNAVALTTDGQAFISQHIGDLETSEAFDAFQRVIVSLETLYEAEPALVACDRHPDYLSTRWARDSSLPRLEVQHHYAHVLSCMTENDICPPALGIAWDGTGFGLDGSIWGGEFLRVNKTTFDRIAHLRTFRLPGGDRAAKEPRRAALGLLYEIFGDPVFEMRNLLPVVAFMPTELTVISQMLKSEVNSPKCSSIGRLFDAVSSILGLREKVRFEAQAAMELEFIVDPNEQGSYDFALNTMIGAPAVIDWEPLVHGIIADILGGRTPARIAAKFHNTLVEMMVRVAVLGGEEKVALSGGCFQNRYLTERAVRRLRHEGFKVYWHQRVPTNDGGIALGQAAAAAAAAAADKEKPKKGRLSLCV